MHAAKPFRAVRAASVTRQALILSLITLCARGDGSDSEVLRQLNELRQQNTALQEQLKAQQSQIEGLARRLSDIQSHPAAQDIERTSKDDGDRLKDKSVENAFGKLRLSGEGAAGFFKSGRRGQYPNDEFRIDEAKLFVEAPLWEDVYFFSEINAFSREEQDIDLRAGELYVDFENISKLWDQDRQLNLRLGRLDIPFGEEYLSRDAIDNPLITHSIMDFWGVDEGAELYGDIGRVQYVLAVQNGGAGALHDYTGDKSVTARIGADPFRWLHVSASAMRTGDVRSGDPRNSSVEKFSELWLGPGFIESIGSPSTTRFHADILQGDFKIKLRKTTLAGAGGILRYDDNDPLADNRRDVYFYNLTGTQPLVGGLYAAARWGQVFAPKGFPIVGLGEPFRYFFQSPPVLTKDLSLLSLGLGYRFGKHLVVKGEYAFEWGHELSGAKRTAEDLFSTSVAFGF